MLSKHLNIIVTLLAFVGTIFCGALMTLPQVYASEHIPCDSSETHEHVPCSKDNHNHHQLESYTVQKSDISAPEGKVAAQITFPQWLFRQEITTRHLPGYFNENFYERSQYRIKHIQTRKQE